MTDALPTATYTPTGTAESYTVDWAAVPAASVAYALEIATSRIIGAAGNNSPALTAARLVREALGPYSRTKGGDHSARDAAEKAWLAQHASEVAEAAAADALERRKAAHAAILDGTIADSARQSSSDPLAPFIVAVLTNAVRKHAQATGQAVPTGAALTAALKAVRERVGEAKVRAAAQALADAADL